MIFRRLAGFLAKFWGRFRVLKQMKPKYSIDELLRTRCLGRLGKHSTFEDAISKLGPPDYKQSNFQYTPRSYQWNYHLTLQLKFSVVKKRLASIILWLDHDWHRMFFPYDEREEILRKSPYKNLFVDFEKYANADRSLALQYAKELGFECTFDPEYGEDTFEKADVFYPINDKPFTRNNPRFHLEFDLEKDRLHNITIKYKY